MEASDKTVLLVSTSRKEACIPIAKFSCCDKLFRVTALVFCFMRNLKIKAKVLNEVTDCQGEITVEEIANAETQWIRSVQKALKTQAKHEFRLYEVES